MSAAEWIDVGRADDVPQWEGRRVTVGELPIAVVRTEAGVYALDAECPHAGGPLQDGLVADGCVTCPLHGRRFDLRTGVGLLPGHEDEAVTTYEVVERAGRLWLRLPPRTPAGAAAATRG